MQLTITFKDGSEAVFYVTGDPTREAGDGNPQPVSVAETMGEWQLLADQGLCDYEPCDDEESQEFAADVRRLNPDWGPGAIPKVPRGYRDAAAERAHVPRRQLNTRPRPRAAARGRRPSRRVARTSGSRGDPSREADEPPLEVVPLAQFRADVNAWLEGVR